MATARLARHIVGQKTGVIYATGRNVLPNLGNIAQKQGCRFTKMIGRAQLLRPLADPAGRLGGGHNFDGAT